MRYQAVMFDLDGTLLDTLDDLADCMNTVLSRWGLPQHGREAYKYFVGDGVENLVRRALPELHRDEGRISEGVRAMREEYSKRWADKTRPYEGIPDMLNKLTARGVRMTVLSNKPDDFTRMTVDKLLSPWRFDRVVGVQPNGRKKPDPTAALEIAKELGIAPAHFLYLGDTDTDMRTAVAAGMFPVGALWGFRPAEELTANGARVLIPRPADLLELL
jgi:phosphoglycolate phosphatase